MVLCSVLCVWFMSSVVTFSSRGGGSSFSDRGPSGVGSGASSSRRRRRNHRGKGKKAQSKPHKDLGSDVHSNTEAFSDSQLMSPFLLSELLDNVDPSLLTTDSHFMAFNSTRMEMDVDNCLA